MKQIENIVLFVLLVNILFGMLLAYISKDLVTMLFFIGVLVFGMFVKGLLK